jgi:tyrosinase
MGENETAAFDPIFLFHHCWVDNIFWQWQVKHNDKLNTMNEPTLLDSYPGTNSVDMQGPNPGMTGGTWLTMETPLYPFKSPSNPTEWATSNEMTNILKLGYSYENVNTDSPMLGVAPVKPVRIVARISGVNKTNIEGSFMIGVLRTVDGKDQLLGMRVS